jgi:N-acetylmuramoyl-L-alanine amidase
VSRMLRRLADIDTVVIHCADTPNGVDRWRAKDIDDWHKARAFKREERMVHIADVGMLGNVEGKSPTVFRHIGYHRVIHLSGEVVTGRYLVERGAHVQNHNARTVGICMIGADKFSRAQWAALKNLVTWLRANLVLPFVVGHRDLNDGRTCPGFDVETWTHNGMEPLDEHVIDDEEIEWQQ